MFEHDLFKLNTSIADGLKSINEIKTLVVKFQNYEYAAKLRDIEEQLVNVEKSLSKVSYPYSPMFKIGGELYFRQLFSYANMNCWDIPENFINSFVIRKARLNDSIKFTDEGIEHLVNLNQKLAAIELHAIEFINFLNYIITVKGIKKSLSELIIGDTIIKCYTNNDKYTFNPSDFNRQSPFYQFKFPMDSLINASAFYYRTDHISDTPESNLLRKLPIKFIDEKINFLFYVLVNDGLLAWEDFLNIEQIELMLDIRYDFSTLNAC